MYKTYNSENNKKYKKILKIKNYKKKLEIYKRETYKPYLKRLSFSCSYILLKTEKKN